jgi:hypothetical protein
MKFFLIKKKILGKFMSLKFVVFFCFWEMKMMMMRDGQANDGNFVEINFHGNSKSSIS